MPSDLQDKVLEWLRREGYPLEFSTALAFSRFFDVSQGIYVRTSADESPREIDVVAKYHQHVGEHLVRIEHVVECKWSRDKPWVVFCSPFGEMAPSACINQTIASSLGRAALWLEAGSKRLEKLRYFAVPKQPGFGGRQALGESQDNFYKAAQGVVTAASARMASYDQRTATGVELPYASVVAFPLIVIEGELFEAYADSAHEMQVRPVRSTRLHWKGAAAWNFHATIDIVTSAALSDYVEERAREAPTLLRALSNAVTRIERFSKSGRRADLRVTRGPRGTLGLPSLLARVAKAHVEAAGAAKKQLTSRPGTA